MLLIKIKKKYKKIPDEYSSFPAFRENIEKLYTKNQSNYMRCTMDFRDVLEDELSKYISKITEERFIKMSEVRYEKENTYIIIDNAGKYLNLVFHIKKSM